LKDWAGKHADHGVCRGLCGKEFLHTDGNHDAERGVSVGGTGSYAPKRPDVVFYRGWVQGGGDKLQPTMEKKQRPRGGAGTEKWRIIVQKKMGGKPSDAGLWLQKKNAIGTPGTRHAERYPGTPKGPLGDKNSKRLSRLVQWQTRLTGDRPGEEVANSDAQRTLAPSLPRQFQSVLGKRPPTGMGKNRTRGQNDPVSQKERQV